MIPVNVGIVCPFGVLPVTSGAARRVLEVAKGLHHHGLSVYVLHPGRTMKYGETFRFLGFDGFETSWLIRSFKWARALDTYLHPLNLPVLNILHRMIKHYKIDILQGEQPWSILPSMMVAGRTSIPFVLDEHNVECRAPSFARRAFAVAPYILAVEKFAVSVSDAIMATSDQDKEDIASIYRVPKKKIFIAPNGVDAEKLNSVDYSTSRRTLGFRPSEKVVVFHGELAWWPNLEAAEVVLNFIAPRLPDVTFLIIGDHAPIALRTKAERMENVRVVGYVRNIEAYIEAADACIVPLRRGSGTRLKVLEYLAAGKPMVSTAKGCEGFGLEPDVHAKICDEIDGCFVDSLKEVLFDRKVASEMGSVAKEYARRFDWRVLTKGIADTYLKILDERA